MEAKGKPASRICLVTGSGGFIGGHLSSALAQDPSIQCRALSRRPMARPGAFLGDLLDPSLLAEVCKGVDTIFHCAGYAHAFASRSETDAELHWRINFEATRNLVDVAGRVGVKRFVFLSTIKAMADPGESCADEAFPGVPNTAYGESKLAAEKVVLEAGSKYGMHVVNLRLAMVYGSGGHGNLERMARMVKSGRFPPLPETGNRRSLIHVRDVVQAIQLVANDDRAKGQTYILASPDTPSGRELFDGLRKALDLPAIKWSIPLGLMQVAASLGDGLGALLRRRMPLDSEALKRLMGSSWYSGAKISKDLGWRPQVALEVGLLEMVADFRK